MDHHVPHNLGTIFTITFVSTVFLVLMKGMRNISATPFAISSDHSKEYFSVPTMFKVVRITITEFDNKNCVLCDSIYYFAN